MRILHALHDYLPDQVAGVEVYTQRLAEQQGVRRDNDVAILYATVDPNRTTGSFARVDTSDSTGTPQLFEVVQNRDWWRFEQTYRDHRLDPAFEAVFDAVAPDILHVQHIMNLGLPLLEIARRRAIPVVMTLHDQFLACAMGGQRIRANRQRCDVLVPEQCALCTSGLVGPALRMRGIRQSRQHVRSRNAVTRERREGRGNGREESGRAADFASGLIAPLRSSWEILAQVGGADRIETRWREMRGLGGLIDAFVAPSREIFDAALSFGLPVARLHRIPHGFPSPPPSEMRRPLAERARKFGYVGSIVPHKGVHTLIEAFSKMPAETTLEIYGSLSDAPDYVRELRSRVRHSGISFEGERAPSSIPAVLDSLDCVIAPSIWRENAPLVVQESFLAGRPVVASDLGGHSELLADGGGLLFPAGDAVALGAVLRRLTDEPGLLHRLVDGLPAVRTIAEHEQTLRALYDGVLARSAGSTKTASRDPRPVVFLDRDGVINHDSPGFIRSAAEWRPIEGSVAAIARLSRGGFRVVVLSNQSGVGRGLLEVSELDAIHDRLIEAVESAGGQITSILYCPHAPSDNCECRKPRPGLIDRAARELGVAIEGAPFIGDRTTDLEAARTRGCRPIFVDSGTMDFRDLGPEWTDVRHFRNLAEAADQLLAEHASHA